MHVLNLPGGVVTLFESSSKLPESRRVECDYYTLINSAVGSTMADVDRHFQPLVMLVDGDDPQALLDGLNNLRYLFYNLLYKQLSPRSLALACLVDTVDGKKWDDYSPEGLELLVRGLSDMGLTDEDVEQLLPDVKKNS